MKAASIKLIQNACTTMAFQETPRQSNTDEPTRCNNDLLIYKISSTCFGQYFAHYQEREIEIFTAYGILQRWIYRKLCSFVCDMS